MFGSVLIFLGVAFTIGGLVWYKRRELEQRGLRRFGDDSAWEGPGSRFQPLRERVERLPQRRPKPVEPVFDFRQLLENTHCEVCRSAPLVQFRNPAPGATLEFCGHHATRQEPALKAKGFTVTVDGRN